MIILPDDKNHTLSDVLPNLGSDILQYTNFWEEELCFSDPHYISAVLDAVVIQQENLIERYDLNYVENLTFADIRHCKDMRICFEDNSIPNTILSLLQIHLTLVPLKINSLEKQLVKALNWVGCGLGDNLDFEKNRKQVFYPMIGELYSKFAYLSPLNIASWFGCFYYVWRTLACDYLTGESLIDPAINAFNRLLDNGLLSDWASNFGFLACWLATYNHSEAEKVIKHLESNLDSLVIDDFTRLVIFEVLSTRAGRFSTKQPNLWAREALELHEHRMSDYQKFFFLSNAIHRINEDIVESLFPKLIIALENMIASVVGSANEYVHQENRRSIIADTITPLLGNLIGLRQGEYALKTMFVWHGRTIANLGGTLLLVGNNQESVMLCTQSACIEIPRGEQGSQGHQVLTNAMSRFTGTSCSIVGNKEHELNKPDNGRFGVPVENYSDEYEKAFFNYYKLEECKVFLNQINVERLIFLPAEHHPIQYMLKKYTDKCWPLAVSLLSKTKDRQINRIAIFSGANSLTEEIEINLLRKLFNKLQPTVELDIFKDEDAVKDTFISLYAGNEYDVIWVMSHGDFDHWSPETVSIAVGNDKVALLDIADLELTSDQRRLLILNVCDGATSRSTGSISKIGMAPAIAGKNQCVISHLWPVNPYAALCFSTFLALNLANGHSFFEAYKLTLSGLISGKEYLLDEIKKTGIEMEDDIERIVNSGIDLSLMAHSGSSAFFE